MDGYQIKEDLLVPASEGIATIVEAMNSNKNTSTKNKK